MLRMSEKRPMPPEHKAALAKGRAESRAVKEYLEGLRSTKPRRGRKRTAETVRKQLSEIEMNIGTADPLDELLMIQKRRDLEAELEAMSAVVDMAALEAAFVEVAASYSASKQISYASWRDVGVEASVLKRAGIARGS